MNRSKHCLQRSSPFLSKEEHPKAMRMGNRFSRLIIHDAYQRNPKPLPVVVFLHGDHTGQPRRELDKLVDDFLETSGVVFGIRDYRAPKSLLIGEQSKIMH